MFVDNTYILGNNLRTYLNDTCALIDGYEQVTALIHHVDEYNVDKTFLRLFNKHNELSDICNTQIPSAEAYSTSILSTSFIVLEGLKEKRLGIMKRIINFFKKIILKVKEWYNNYNDKLESLVRTMHKAATYAKNECKVDLKRIKKFKKREVRINMSNDFGALAIVNLMENFNYCIDHVKKILAQKDAVSAKSALTEMKQHLHRIQASIEEGKIRVGEADDDKHTVGSLFKRFAPDVWVKTALDFVNTLRKTIGTRNRIMKELDELAATANKTIDKSFLEHEIDICKIALQAIQILSSEVIKYSNQLASSYKISCQTVMFLFKVAYVPLSKEDKEDDESDEDDE